LNNYRNFNQWSLAVNFDFYNYTKTYENITIDEDTQMNIERDSCDMNFIEIINIWKYIENIQQYGKWTCQSKFTKSPQNFISQFNLDIFKAVKERQWFEAQRDATKYFLLVKKTHSQNAIQVRSQRVR
jgi:hypothetical protein